VLRGLDDAGNFPALFEHDDRAVIVIAHVLQIGGSELAAFNALWSAALSRRRRSFSDCNSSHPGADACPSVSVKNKSSHHINCASWR
jgi:hypothetical protein